MFTNSNTTLRLVVAGDSTRQIAHDAVVAYRRKQQLVMQRDTITDLGIFHGHNLTSWRVSPDARYSAVQCWACAEGARLDMETTCGAITAGFTRRCVALPALMGTEVTL